MVPTTRAIRKGNCRFDIITNARTYKFKTTADQAVDEWLTAINGTIRNAVK